MKTQEKRYYAEFRQAGYGARDSLRNAKLLEWAREHGVEFGWDYDDSTNRDWTNEGPEYSTHICMAHIPHTDYYTNCGGIDFGYIKGTEKTIRGKIYAECRDPDSGIYKLDMEAQLIAEIKAEYERDAIAGLGNAVVA